MQVGIAIGSRWDIDELVKDGKAMRRNIFFSPS